MIVIFDLEATGLDTAHDEIVEFAAQIGLGRGAETWTCRIRPTQPIPAAASAIHGIRDADVATCDPFPAHAARIRSILTGADVLVGYNLAYDLELLDAELDRHGLPPLDLSRTLVVDALALWRREEPRTLAGAHERFVGGGFEGAHRASEDVAATGRVLEGMLEAFGLGDASWPAIAERAEPGRRRWIGSSGHVEWRAGVPVMTFGRHRGRALDAVAATEDGRSYLGWVLDARFPPHVKRIARLALELDPRALRRRLAGDYGAPEPPDGPRPEELARGEGGSPPHPDREPDPAGSAAGATPAPAAASPSARPTPAHRATPSAPAMAAPPATPATPATPVILFDGVCNLCQGWVRFVIARDRRARFRFASLQSNVARTLLAEHPETHGTDSIVLVDDGRAHMKSTAALRILRELGGAWSALQVFRIVPRPLRDAVYDLVARHRYRWFGRRDACMIPTPEIRSRFIDQS
jgi:predicted DCC family thiol-disulfide oxidoreductase YuxK